ncbi:efflux RND transporter periplasmic adaptor subunit [Pseudoprimorskyibacter insulae]|uniref:Cobalt-zinc-cadmium resistance protein CzcB n=1 Tax=Pseudoprimorskyibacter insulae TaxID=1695997 RepID=A0A2R8AW71_9RHOB|nr:efflux RND transporter periplasmic adaptor subunit [Pseudoprimorskyibacter insulae]SPF80285.1 Cobalt-zinc-cadmium resistance protein CzcB [Pseudoprimorskyibacter insulae]
MTIKHILAACLFPVAVSAQTDCLVVPNDTVDVGAAVSGLVQAVTVDRGDRVDEGQALFQLDDRSAQARLALARLRAQNDQNVQAARARLDLARTTAHRYEVLQQSQSAAFNDTLYQEALAEAQVAAFSLRNAELEYEAAQLELAQIEGDLALLTVVSPISGIVTERRLSVGEYLDQREAVLTVVGLDPLYIEGFLPSDQFGSLAMGDQIAVTLDLSTRLERLATVSVVDQMIDPASRTFGFRLVLDNPGLEIPTGAPCALDLPG